MSSVGRQYFASRHTFEEIQLADEVALAREDGVAEGDGLDTHPAVLPGSLDDHAKLLDDELVKNIVLEGQVVVVNLAGIERVGLVGSLADRLDFDRETLDDDLETAAGSIEPDLGAPCSESGTAKKGVLGRSKTGATLSAPPLVTVELAADLDRGLAAEVELETLGVEGSRNNERVSGVAYTIDGLEPSELQV